MPDECQLPDFNELGLLPPGLHTACFDVFRRKFGFNPKRQEMVDHGLKAVCIDLAKRGDVHRFFVGGSFVTQRLLPRNVNIYVLAPNSRNPFNWFIKLKSLEWLANYQVKCELAIQGATGPGSEHDWQHHFGHELDGTPKGIVVLTF
jgi:hypothetical protein